MFSNSAWLEVLMVQEAGLLSKELEKKFGLQILPLMGMG